MSDEQASFRVIVIQDNGERVVVTTATTRERAEQVAEIIRDDGTFAKVVVEASGSA